MAMPLAENEFQILVCMYNKKIIGRNHKRVDSIAGLCHIQKKKGLKRMLRRLADSGYLIQSHGPSYSLFKKGVRFVEANIFDE